MKIGVIDSIIDINVASVIDYNIDFKRFSDSTNNDSRQKILATDSIISYHICSAIDSFKFLSHTLFISIVAHHCCCCST